MKYPRIEADVMFTLVDTDTENVETVLLVGELDESEATSEGLMELFLRKSSYTYPVAVGTCTVTAVIKQCRLVRSLEGRGWQSTRPILQEAAAQHYSADVIHALLNGGHSIFDEIYVHDGISIADAYKEYFNNRLELPTGIEDYIDWGAYGENSGVICLPNITDHVVLVST